MSVGAQGLAEDGSRPELSSFTRGLRSSGVIKGFQQTDIVYQASEYDHEMKELMASPNNIEGDRESFLWESGSVHPSTQKVENCH